MQFHSRGRQGYVPQIPNSDKVIGLKGFTFEVFVTRIESCTCNASSKSTPKVYLKINLGTNYTLRKFKISFCLKFQTKK